MLLRRARGSKVADPGKPGFAALGLFDRGSGASSYALFPGRILAAQVPALMVISASVSSFMFDCLLRRVASQPDYRAVCPEIDAGAGTGQLSTEVPASRTSLIYLGRVDVVFFHRHILKTGDRSILVGDGGTSGKQGNKHQDSYHDFHQRFSSLADLT